MKLIFYADKKRGVGKQLWELNRQLDPQYRGTFHETINDLTERLIQPRDAFNIVILLAACREDLLNFIAIKKLLFDFRIILILPDRENTTISAGHKLCPRYLSYFDSEFNDIVLVLNKMIKSSNPKPFAQKTLTIREEQYGH
jgi:hypothetical protein